MAHQWAHGEITGREGEKAWTWVSAFIGIEGAGLGRVPMVSRAHSVLVNLNIKVGILKYEKKRNRNSPSSQLLKSTKGVKEKARGGGSLVLYLAVWLLLSTNAEDKSTSNDSFSLEGGGTKGGQGPSTSGLGLTAARCPALHRNIPSWGAHSQFLTGV